MTVADLKIALIDVPDDTEVLVSHLHRRATDLKVGETTYYSLERVFLIRASAD